MVSYATNELISSSDFAKKFGTYLSQIKDNAVEKLAILKNNKVEAVLISKDEYENMKETMKYYEDQEIKNTIKDRVSKPYKTISQEDMLKELGINSKDLEE